jgi:ATP-dependent helicase HrpA
MNSLDLDDLRELLPNCLRRDRLCLDAEIAGYRQQGSQAGIPHEQLRRWLVQARHSIEVRHRRHEHVPQVSYPANLPITARRDEIVRAIRAHQVIVIAGETGSGKTTQIPKMCLEAGFGVEGKIGCTQPRRVAALSISRRVAEELGVAWGKEVGCKIRFSDRSSPESYIKFMTDGILLAETQGNLDLDEYEVIVIDEAHERSLNIDFLLGHLKLLLPRRPDLKLIITSATIDTEAFSKAFGNAPVLEVSGRTYPVEIRYAPYDANAEEAGDLTYIDAAVSAVETALLESDRGDVLVFMPSERDIRETKDDLQGRYGAEAEIVPLFGRLSGAEQERVFAPSPKRKVIVATNIAETSLTIPGVRYVIDTGLARISRYSPRTRTKRLPIEPVSQSSANQRAGRSGRVENGVCIRLYSDEDFGARPRFTQPEVQRANLAEVILKMKAWRLGEMETFPFINPPQPLAINAGYALLQELGALDDERRLTPLGRELARLPVDPSIGRMILQAHSEGAVEDVLVVAAGLSIQDPRERPVDQQAADLAHRQFLDADSDFLTLLNIWNAYDAKLEALKTQNQMRRFCRAHFLSYNRMREWIDVHAQLKEAVQTERGTPNHDRREAAHSESGALPRHRSKDAIHRSILSGLLGHIAQRAERNVYRASDNRQFMVWPGSSLFERDKQGKTHGKQSESEAAKKVKQPEWLMAGEIVETSRLFGRTVAGVSPEWIGELGEHISKKTYGEPFWDDRTGRVLARERITLFGLVVQDRAIDYGRVEARKATEAFVRFALIEGELQAPHRFLEHNRVLRQKLELWRTRQRDYRLPSIEDALFDFYLRHLENVSSIHDLNRVVRARSKSEPNFLCATEQDLTGGEAVAWDTAAFPNSVLLGDQSAPLEYAYAPGEEHDGITVKVPVALANRIDPGVLDWLVPGLRREQIEFLLKALPKTLRVPLMPIPARAAELAEALDPNSGLDGLRRLVQERFGVSIPADAWKRESLPNHLRPRIAITGKNQQVVAAGRDLAGLKAGLEKHETAAEQHAWARAAQQFERYDIKHWTFGDLPEHLPVSDAAGATLYAFPGLEVEGHAVHLKLFRTPEAAQAATRPGFVRLVELALQKELAWVQKDLRALEKCNELGPGEEPSTIAYENVKRHIIRVPEPVLPLKQQNIEAAIQHARSAIPGLVPKLIEQVKAILALRQQIVTHRAYPAPAPAAANRSTTIKDPSRLASAPTSAQTRSLAFLPDELGALLPKDFLLRVPFDRLPHWPRYLKALLIRADRALLNLAKDSERARQVQPYVETLRTWQARKELNQDTQQALEQFGALVEEFKVSIFAQELGTTQPVSAKRLDALLEKVKDFQAA